MTTGEIMLSDALLEPHHRQILRETLCHEMAHLVTYWQIGSSQGPHGAQWQSLMRQAAVTPRLQVAAPMAKTSVRSRNPVRYEHRCPVCQMRRIARRRMSAWRCADCVRTGLPGYLEITPLSSGSNR